MESAVSAVGTIKNGDSTVWILNPSNFSLSNFLWWQGWWNTKESNSPLSTGVCSFQFARGHRTRPHSNSICFPPSNFLEMESRTRRYFYGNARPYVIRHYQHDGVERNRPAPKSRLPFDTTPKSHLSLKMMKKRRRRSAMITNVLESQQPICINHGLQPRSLLLN